MFELRILVLLIVLFVNVKFWFCGFVRKFFELVFEFWKVVLRWFDFRLVYVRFCVWYGMILMLVGVYFFFVYVFWIVFCSMLMCLFFSDCGVGSRLLFCFVISWFGIV